MKTDTKKRRILVGLILAGLAGPSVSHGQTHWLGTVDTNWFNASNWQNGMVPVASSNAAIYDTVAPTRYCVVPANSSTAVCAVMSVAATPQTLNRIDVEGTLKVGYRINAAGNAKVNVRAGGVLTVPTNYIGYGASAAATMTQQGTVTVGAEMSVGDGNGSASCTYNAQAGTLTMNVVNFWLGRTSTSRDGVGVLNISGADVTAIDVHSGRGAAAGATNYNAKGTVTVSGGSLSCRNFYNGNSGNVLSAPAASNTALLDVSGGSVTVSNYYNGFYRAIGSEKVYPTTRITGSNASFRVTGVYTSLPNATVVAVITAPTHTAIRVDGSVSLAGTLRVMTNGVFRPARGTSWDLFVADADGIGNDPLNGTFQTVDLSSVTNLGDWRVTYDLASKKVVLSLQPGIRGAMMFVR